MVKNIRAKFTGYLLPNGKERKLLSFMWGNFLFYTYRNNIANKLEENREYNLEINRKVKKEFWKQGRVFRKLELK